MNEKNQFWNIVRTVTTLIASLLIPLVVVLITQLYTGAEAKREREARYVELAIEILRGKPQEETTAIRAWAIEIVSRYSPVKFPQDALAELKVAPIQIRGALDGNLKSSGEIMGEVDALMQKWKDLSEKDLSDLMQARLKTKSTSE